MQLTHRFSVPASPDEAWRAFGSLERVAPCFPGAKITDIDDTTYTGSIKIKFGPLPLVYVGTASVVQRDQVAGRMVVEARGEDRRGHGTVTAIVSAHFTRDGAGTDVAVTTDLSLTGRVAQFGGGVLEEVSARLLKEFLTCLRPRFAQGLGAPEPTGTAAHGASGTATGGPAEAGAAPASGSEPAQDSGGRVTGAAAVGSVSTSRAANAGTARPRPAGATSSGDTAASDVSRPHFQVLSTVAPPLLRRYGPAVGGAVLLGLVLLGIRKAVRDRNCR